MKQNCWEFMNCGRQMGGRLAHEGVCPSATAVPLNGVHGGQLAGRACWVIQNTMCGGELQGAFAEKYRQCERCDFYKTVMREEGSKFILSPVLLGKLHPVKTAIDTKQRAIAINVIPAHGRYSR